ncbi:MAG: 3-phosphoshikimate 1-carboxyvinyltransferase [Robiginitomaculum sp.]|nr:MAG: 3-phosphoshikimate 1-carboxyvinyltransferase [Robiginitomaculum sp.]
MCIIGGVACHVPAPLSKRFFLFLSYEVFSLVSTTPASAHPSFRLCGKVRVPGDKSISHRALILGMLATGQTRITGLLESEDVLHTLAAMRALGAHIEKGSEPGCWIVDGIGTDQPTTPNAPLNFGNSGTGARLCMGLVAGLGVTASFIGDQSLSGRPMNRVLKPLKALGVIINSNDGCLPVTLAGGTDILAQAHETHIASAQVKSALMLASLRADGVTEIIEPALSRDHTERMLMAFGAKVRSESLADGRHRARLYGPAHLQGTKIDVPGDPSSAAFPMVAALCIPGSDIMLQDVLMNPTRTGFIKVARAMGGKIDILNRRISGGEDIADIRVRGSRLHGITTRADIVPSMVDEFPALAVLAAFASGTTMMQGLGELRVKESDRIARSEEMLRAMGVNVKSGPDWMQVEGTGAVWGKATSTALAPVRTDGDHRIAMAALILGLAAFRQIEVCAPECIATSYPAFFDDMRSLGAKFQIVEEGVAC